MRVLVIETNDLGDRSYVIANGDVGAVVDPQRDIDRVLEVVDANGIQVTHVLETHMHNDYLTGGPDLARVTGAAYVVAEADDVSVSHRDIRPGEVIEAGRLAIEAVATPGHTKTHLSYVLRHGSEVVVCTGGSMLFGAVGRTDLLGDDLAEELAREQYRSVRLLADKLPDATSVLPTHGFGSFCSSDRSQEADESTVGEERGRNPALTEDDEDSFVRSLLAGFGAYPAYYRHMAPLNRVGPPAIDLDLPPQPEPGEITTRIGSGEWVIDLRDRRAFARSHRRGTANFEAGKFLPTYAGWVLPWDTPFTVLADSEEQAAEARRALARIGYDAWAGWAPADAALVDHEPASYEVADFPALAEHDGGRSVPVLDVRREDEWEEGHVAGAHHIHLAELPGRLSEVPETDEPLWVHCGSGFRAAVASSILDGDGRPVVLIDDEWTNAREAGVEVVTGD